MMAEKIVNTTSDTLDQKYKLLNDLMTVAPPLSPIILFVVFGGSLEWFGKVSEAVALYIILAGFGITIVWFLLDLVRNRSDNAVFMTIHNLIEPIDKEAEAEIYEGLQSLRIISEDVDDQIESLVRRQINNIAVNALVPSTYRNHHSRELIEFGKDGYIERKKRPVYRAFDVLDRGYKQMVINNLPSNITFDAAVDSFVCQWITKAVIPAVHRSCARKILEYRKLMERKDLSRGFKKIVTSWIEKNEKYKLALDELKLRSSICMRSTIV